MYNAKLVRQYADLLPVPSKKLASVQAAGEAETITRVLYPNDNNESGKELRLKQVGVTLYVMPRR